MILTVNNAPTSQPTPELIAKLKSCDEVSTYREAGWFCAAGYVNGNRIVHLHFGSEAAYNAAVNPDRATMTGEKTRRRGHYDPRY